MTETLDETDAKPTAADADMPPDADVKSQTAPAATATDRTVRYCPTCHSRYVKAASECVSCGVPLVEEQPRDVSLFRPELDVPFVIALILYVFGRDKLGGEAQSFGLIFLIVGFATLVTFRAISYAEWLGRR